MSERIFAPIVIARIELEPYRFWDSTVATTTVVDGLRAYVVGHPWIESILFPCEPSDEFFAHVQIKPSILNHFPIGASGTFAGDSDELERRCWMALVNHTRVA